MKEKYEKSPQTSVRIIVTIQNGTDIKTSSLWINKEMLGDVYREQGFAAFRRKIRESLAEQTNWVANEITDMFGFLPIPVTTKKPWWRFW